MTDAVFSVDATTSNTFKMLENQIGHLNGVRSSHLDVFRVLAAKFESLTLSPAQRMGPEFEDERKLTASSEPCKMDLDGEYMKSCLERG